jgi:ABC-type lipoprotein release transport system permease subunit
MFLTYLRRELRRRMRQAVVIALGLALGIGLVITVTAASSGVSSAQAKVLHSLYGVGTDVTVTHSPSRGSGGPSSFRIGSGGGSRSPAKAGTSFSRDTLLSAGLGTLKQSAVSEVARLRHVSAAAGALSLTDTRISGTISSSSSSSASSSSPTGGRRPGGSFKTSSFSVAGVDLSTTKTGVLSSAAITSGRTFRATESDSNVALVSSNYARSQGLKNGSTITIAGKKFTVIGIVSGTSTDVYIPLARAQALSGLTGDVNTIYVSADSSSNISTVSKEISAALPKATVTTSASLASQVTGSLSSAARLANSLGKWLAVAVLAAAFGLASLLTMSAVSRRVREFGTLKALGWRSRRVVGQVIGEAVAVGVIGGVAGVALGFAGAGLIDALAPPLTASTGAASQGGAGAFGGAFSRLASSTANTVTVHLTAVVTVGAIVAAVALAVGGGLLAGSLGGWRAARLRPAAALARVE